jgi:beta-phosphoglucomutase-like phosphatase (HAD superfamily)
MEQKLARQGRRDQAAEAARHAELYDLREQARAEFYAARGYREYTELESGKKLAKQYTEDWRKALERVREWMQEYQETEEGAESAITALGKQRSILEKVLATLKQYPAVEARLGRLGVNQTAVQIQIDNLRKDIQRLRDAERGNRGGNNGGGRGPGGMGGGRR